MNKSDLPTSKKYLDNFAKLVLLPLFRGQSTFIQSLPNSGVNSLTKYVLEYPQKVNIKLQKKLKSYSIIRLDAGGIENVDELWSSFTIFTDNKTYKSINRNDLTEILSDDFRQPIIIINSLHKIFNHKDVLRELFQLSSQFGLAKFLLISYKELEKTRLDETLIKFRIQNITYLSLRNNEDIKVLLNKEERWFNYKINPKAKERIVKLSGGYSSYARSLLSIYNENSSLLSSSSIKHLSNNDKVRIYSNRIYNSLSKESQRILNKLFLVKSTYDSDYIDNLKLYNKKKKKFFSPLFKHFLQNYISSNSQLEKIAKSVYFSGIDLKKILSKQEFKIFKQLWDNKNKIVSREEIAKKLWGKSWQEKYSDWAIDKVISKIRKKIYDQNKIIIQTVKGKGFRLNNK